MSNAESAIEASFRDLVQRRHYRGISVKDICDGAGLSRKTFYTYFTDKDALIELIFDRDVIGPARSICNLLSVEEIYGLARSIHERMFKAVYDDREFYIALIVPMHGRETTFTDLATSCLYDFHRGALIRLGKPADSVQGDYIASYFSSALAQMIEKWVVDGFQLEPADVAAVYDRAALTFWKSLVKEGL